MKKIVRRKEELKFLEEKLAELQVKKGTIEGRRAHWVAPHRDGSPKYLWEHVCSGQGCDSEQHKSLSDWKQLLLYFCYSMLYKTPALLPQLLSGDAEMLENVGQTSRRVMLFIVTCTDTLKIRVSIYVKSCLRVSSSKTSFSVCLYSAMQCL